MTPHQLNTFITLLGIPTTDTFPDRVKFLMENGLILLNDEGRYICTAKGEAHIRQLCRLSLPQEAWADHNDKLYKDYMDFREAQTTLVREHLAIKPLDVLHSLVSDARAGTETFDDFCSNYGYDTDSRKAYATWQQYQTGAREFLRVLGSSDMLTRLEEAFQDY